MKKALVHDWYYISGGAEKVIHSFNSVYDDFEHYALVDFLDEKDRQFILNGASVHTSFIQNLPTAKSNHRKFLQLFPYAIEQFDLQDYDLVLSSSASIAKGVLTTQDQLHICYCHSPMRYAWDLYHQYLEDSNLKKGLKGFYAKQVLHKMRQWDISTVNRVDFFVANSKYIARRIKKIYNRESTVIYPPVDVNRFTLQETKKEYYLTVSRMVPYKKLKLIVETFNEMPNKKLIVLGDGPDYKHIKKIAKSNIELKGFMEADDLKVYMQEAKAFVFAAKEDFGIVPVEAQACGTPVIGYNAGGLRETVKDGETGVFFDSQTTEAIKAAVEKFESLTFDANTIRENALRFSTERFEREMKAFIETKYKEFKEL
ncbi:glycosyltransferase family 4 protein [Subsaximicrobium wynnwilliamsii]|uniref:Glycosyltransferase family 4 protein n=1 Tax=Subsaximicrobium wynnwilliamsii TaxID=291179 RepID=A0A5C6ZHT3_9FLAO|nr:glycosyltransferase [Subsaximicrobium wynnwilliamsii]TXD83948.1 glycosyltransferase family 4 protein [Subsaximicrobium wynnwilliamsii]TXD89688.1 glycosyltransferase family 4 protein [Subsaximicrobium wynnwilliamsii]TXE01673.1 glycosyltransferase family 4 protein [Subsaximicrobium wynnwilliamsii]